MTSPSVTIPLSAEIHAAPVPDVAIASETAAAIAAGLYIDVPMPSEGYLHTLIGLEIIANTNQTIKRTEIHNSAGTRIGQMYTDQTVANTDVGWNAVDPDNVIFRYGEVTLSGTDYIRVFYDQAVGVEVITVRAHLQKTRMTR
jgi:hypothetical protein